jgi:hypothetical protein
MLCRPTRAVFGCRSASFSTGSFMGGARLRLRLPPAPLLGLLPFPLFSFPAGLVSGIFMSADRSRWLFLSLIVVLLLSVRPFLFRLRIGRSSVLPPSRFCGTVRCFFWAFARGILLFPTGGFRVRNLEGVGRRAVGSVYQDPLDRVF